MNCSAFLLVAPVLVGLADGTAASDEIVTTWTAPKSYVQGAPFPVHVKCESKSAGKLPAWMLTPAAFTVDGKPLAERTDATEVSLPATMVLEFEYDLSPAIQVSGDFQLGFAGSSSDPIQVKAFRLAPEGLNFAEMATEDLSQYQALMQTNRGPMLFELWPDVAPNHVRNFCDLLYTGFYEGTLFHRVSPEFMIQGGCSNTKTQRDNPATWGSGGGPRKVKAEFNDRKHVRGVLSAARTTDPDSHSSQFFVMTATSTFLDGKYSAFGKLVDGYDTLDRIANAKGKVNPNDRTVKPRELQEIQHTYVVVPLGS